MPLGGSRQAITPAPLPDQSAQRIRLRSTLPKHAPVSENHHRFLKSRSSAAVQPTEEEIAESLENDDAKNVRFIANSPNCRYPWNLRLVSEGNSRPSVISSKKPKLRIPTRMAKNRCGIDLEGVNWQRLSPRERDVLRFVMALDGWPA